MNRRSDSSEIFDGTIGETQTSRLPISTDEGDVFRAEVYTTINVETDPELGEKLREGTLNRVSGPDGEGTYSPAVSVRYHDPDNRIFALVIPETLRHRSFELRGELLDDLSEVDEAMPDYIANFGVVFGPEELERLEETGTGRLSKIEGAGGDEISVPTPEEIGATESGLDEDSDATPRTGVDPIASTVESADIEEEWEKLEQKREELSTREDQLEEVRERIDRERQRMDQVEQELAAEREELEQMRSELVREREELERERQSLEAERLNLEEQSRRAERSNVESPGSQNTQVVTDDQFIEVASMPDHATDSAVVSQSAPTSSVEPVPGEAAGGATSVDEAARPEASIDIQIDELETDRVPEHIDEDRGGEAGGFLRVKEGRVFAACQLSEEELEDFDELGLRFFVQYHDIEGVPLVAVTVGALEDDGDVAASYGWPLDVRESRHETILHRLSEAMELDVALYTEEGAIESAYEIRAPFEENLEWIRERAEEEFESRGEELGSFEAAASAFREPDYERIGSMRHNFDRDVFRRLDSASDVKLAAGVVGYWSTPDQYEYLVSHRTYPLLLFRRLQEDVVEAAVEMGIDLEEPLRELALEMGIATDEVDLVERQLANFAEVTVRLRSNELDPIDEWQNWDDLIERAESVGVTPDPDVLELAEASLQRAKDYQETEGIGRSDIEADESSEEGSAEAFVEDPAAVDVEELVVGKRSESTGVTYYLPDDAVIDTFDDLADLSREDLEKLLDDPNGRLEAAQMLLERFDAEAVPTVLEASEQMSAPEVTALARFIETKADGLEPELVRALETGGPSAVFVAARALADIESTSALPTLVEAYRDPDRQLNRRAVARTLASYGEKLVPPLVSSIKEDGVDEQLTMLLTYLEEEQEGILDDLADDPSEDVQEAAERARERRL